MYFTTYRSPLLIVILNTIVITWCILSNFYADDELLNVINSKSAYGGGYQISFTSFTKTSCLQNDKWKLSNSPNLSITLYIVYW